MTTLSPVRDLISDKVASVAALTTIVIGGGISGLEAARRCAERGDVVTLIESSAAVGGKLASHVVDGLRLDAGAESLLTRRPEGLQLIEAAGRSGDRVHPATSGAGVWLDRLYPLPRQQLLGIPSDADDPDLPALLGAAGLEGLRNEPELTPGAEPSHDMTVAELVGGQLGTDVVDRLVEPLLGGVYAGRADQISVDAALPGLLEATRRTGSVMAAAASMRAGSPGDGPAFASVIGGLGSLPDSLVNACNLTVLTNTRAVELLNSPSTGWTVVTDGTDLLLADQVIIALPGYAAAPLLGSVAPDAAAVASALEYASVALVTTVFDAGSVTTPLQGTGFLVPPVTGRLTKAATFVTSKWQWVQDVAAGREVLRFSVGRHGDTRGLDWPDDQLVKAVLDEVKDLLGLSGGPRAAAVTHWEQSLPQYRVGHRARVAQVRQMLPPGLAVAGAAWDGVGIPACIASGRNAADRVAEARSSG
ncbi:MAG: protoporphyrinogen oxidase [Actinomycetia bacterium]|nr:protoporphyrinogen oxidase [Actinomycetes bacterium]